MGEAISRGGLPRTGERSCRNEEPCRKPGRIDVLANRQPPRRANLSTRRFGKSGAANMERDRRSRRLPSACPRQGVRAFRSVRRGKARRRQRPVEAPSTPMRQARASERRAGGHAFRARCREPSSVSHIARRHLRRCRNNHDVPLRTAQPPPVRRQPARRQKPRGRPAAPQQPKRQPGPGHVIGNSAVVSKLRADILWAVCPLLRPSSQVPPLC